MAGKRQPISLEAALEEERKEIESLMSMTQASRRVPSDGPRSPSPFMRSPVRSMLDIGSPPPPRQVTRSMLDIDTPLPTPSSTRTSPTLHSRAPVLDDSVRNRSMSDTVPNPASDAAPRSPPLVAPRNTDLTSAYKFHDILPTNVGQALPPKRGSGGAPRGGSIGEALRGSDLSNLVLPGDSTRPFAFRKNKSKSPNNRFSLRSSSPFGNASKRSPTQQGSTYMLDNGEIFDMSNAYRRLSDANLIYGGSSLASLARKKPDDSDGYGRIAKDNLSPYGELLPDESDDDAPNSSDEENERGRKLTTRAESEDGQPSANGEAKSLMAAVEDERKKVVVQPQYRSLFDDPAITVTGPAGERAKPKPSKQVVQPTTSFDQEPMSGTQTPLDPDLDADVNAIKAAQNLQLSLTPIISTPEVHRSIRIIYRGEFPKIQKEAEEDHRRLRKYVVATDLSDESTHALEWAIGTVLRDGDTLIAMYCMDEETSSSVDAGNIVPDDPKAMKEQAAVVNAMAKSSNARTSQSSSSPSSFAFNRATNSPRLRAADGGSATSSPAPGSRNKSRTEEERERAAVDITERVSKLLRKTQLQVRVIVEVIHCKSPKHLITEVIDLVNPTLVILGSRGRSALKGTLLGSFSNYLVTKSSVPVMVARKRLRKKSKYQPPPMKQVNNLANPSARSLEMARID
ncbi:putative universal stress protein [Rosellinia necatrix]|uniref:Putative universal stress protein n=1 Tax=Rosellinia necatrix TaxID=77044 RepID=A0A1W2TVE4_ROSNE|nr:putative universal stress protein [Rosellinia necatrix]